LRKSVQSEVETMGKTIAEIIKEEGFLEGVEKGTLNSKRDHLLRALRVKFKRLPAAIEAEINATQDVKRLADWLDEVVVAKTFSDIHFAARS
jgi:ribosomal protein S8